MHESVLMRALLAALALASPSAAMSTVCSDALGNVQCMRGGMRLLGGRSSSSPPPHHADPIIGQVAWCFSKCRSAPCDCTGVDEVFSIGGCPALGGAVHQAFYERCIATLRRRICALTLKVRSPQARTVPNEQARATREAGGRRGPVQGKRRAHSERRRAREHSR